MLLVAVGIMAGCSDEGAKEPAEKEKVVQEEKEADSKAIKEEESKEEAKVEKKEVESEEADATPSIETDTVYGKLNKAQYEKVSDTMYRDTERDVLYLLADEKIYQAEVNFKPALGLNLEMDQSFLTEHAFDYMASDASLVQKKSEKEFIYESPSLEKQYNVLFTSDTGDGVITRVIVSQVVEF